MLDAVVFDLDGLLIDSEPHWRAAEIEVFASVGLALTEDHCALTTGLRIDEVVERWYARAPWPEVPPAEVTRQIVASVILRIARAGAARPGALEAVAFARAQGVRLELASSSPSALIDAALQRLGLQSTFEVVCSAEHELRGKPDPAVYLTAATRLGVAPGACLAIEDSLNGVRAAKAAGMRCLAVPESSPPDPGLAVADAVVASLSELGPALWISLGGGATSSFGS